MSQAGSLSINTSGSSVVEFLTGNSGGAVGPDASHNINILGNNTTGINVVGIPATNTLTIVATQSTTTQLGVVTLATNAETIAGTDTSKVTTPDDIKAKLGTQTTHGLPIGAGTAAALTWTAAPTNGQLLIGSTGLTPVLANLTSSAGTITITNGAGTINLDLAGGTSAIDSIHPDSGTDPVVPTAAGLVNIIGSGSTTTVGSLNTLTVQLTGLTNHAVLIGAGTSTITKVGPVASTGCLFASNGAASDPGFTIATYPLTTTINQILYSSAANTITGLATANNGLLVTSSAGVPSILGGPGTTGQILQANAAAAPSFSTASYPSTTTVSQILYSSSSNTVAGLATTNRASLSTNSTGVPTWLALTDGQIVIGSTAGSPAAASLTAGTGITITPGSNSITIAATSGGSWTDVTGASQTIAVNNNYLSDRAGAVAFALPATATLGDLFRIVGVQGSWTLSQAANQQIKFGSTATTVGITGSLASTNAGDCIECVATNTSASTIWRLISSVGNITVA